MARVWRRRRSVDTPRPAGRRWARLRRSGSRATQVIARVARRRRPVRPAARRSSCRRPGRRGRRRRPDARGRGGRAGQPGACRRWPAGTDAETGLVPIPLLPGERTPARRLQFALVNGCTLASLLLGMAADLPRHRTATSGSAAVALLACVVFDGCDGGLARRFGVASPFGAQMDSLADMCSFGVARRRRGLPGWSPHGAAPVAAAPPAPWSPAARRSGWPGSTSRRRTAGSSAACRPPWPPPCSPSPC